MVEKSRGILPPNSIWYHFTKSEAHTFVESKPEIKAQLPTDKPIEDLNDMDLQALPGQTEIIEKLIKEAGLPIVTLFD